MTLHQIAFAKACGRYGQATRTCSLHGHCREADRAERNEVRALTGCPDFAASYQLTVSAQGIGDVMQGLAIAAGWKRANPGKHLHLVVPHRQWAELFEGYDSLATEAAAGAAELLPQLRNRGGLHFVEAASKVANAEKAVPALRPLPPAAVAWAEQYRGSIILAPISLGSGVGRNWALGHWLRLEQMLSARGVACVAVGAGTDEPRLRGFQGHVLAGHAAAHVAALMRVSRGVVSCESGMGHLAGALGVPCVVLAAQLIAAPIYSVWPSVKVLQGSLSCGGCRWTGPNFLPACNEVCANLQAITPEFVLPAVLAQPWESMLMRLNCALPAGQARAWADRGDSFGMALRGLPSRPLIVETGTMRQDGDWTAGMSTLLFGRFAAACAGRVVSVDNDSAHVVFARSRVAGLPVDVVLSSGSDWLRSYSGPPIDLLYADSHDTYVPGYAECCLGEVQAGESKVASTGMILIDDTPDGVGKGELAIGWLLAHGWRIVHHGWQCLLRRAV